MQLWMLNVLEAIVLFAVIVWGVYEVWSFYDEIKKKKETRIMVQSLKAHFYRYLLENEPDKVNTNTIREFKKTRGIDSEILPDELIQSVEKMKSETKS